MKNQTSGRPNLLLILTDQQRFDTISALGNPHIQTPNLDRLAAQGTAFTSAYTPSPVCIPARCSLAYGAYPCHTDCWENRDHMPEDGRPTFMGVLSDSGYRTHGVGKCHFQPDAFALRGFQSREMQEEGRGKGPKEQEYYRFVDEQGFDWVGNPNGTRNEMYYIPQPSPVPEYAHPTQWVGNRSVEFIREASTADQPWFLFSSFIHPHPPFTPPRRWYDRYRPLAMPLPHVPPNSEDMLIWANRKQNRSKFRDKGIDQYLVRLIKAHYYACISFVDEQVGRILEALEAAGQLDNTLLIFSSDHGELLGDYNSFGKRCMLDPAARVPLLVRCPGRFPQGECCDIPANLVDIAPTLLEAGDCEKGAMRCDGVDLAALAHQEMNRNTIFSEHHRAGLGSRMILKPEWKYFFSAPDGKEFLFDRIRDPRETKNLAGSDAHRAVLDSLRGELIEHLREAGAEDDLDGNNWRRFPCPVLPDTVEIDPKTGRLAPLP